MFHHCVDLDHASVALGAKEQVPDADDLSSLREIVIARSLQFGNFTLASKQTSGIYVDAKLTTCYPKAIPLVGRVFLRKIQACGWCPAAVGGLTLGADPIAISVARESVDAGCAISAFIVRKEPKRHGMMRFIEGLDQTAGLPVVIIDDVCTTGGSTALAIERAREAGMRVLGAVCLVDREAGASDRLLAEFGCPLHSVFKLSDLDPSSGRL